jgi:4'-phosphopantetheinyl transferase
LEEDFSANLAQLPPGRRQKIARYRQKIDQSRSLAAGLLLLKFLGVEKDEDLTHNPYGQPSLTASGPYFSLSHAGEVAALAIGPSRLGLDLERDRPGLNWDRLAQIILTPKERELRERGPDPKEFAIAVWTLKESLAKALGQGLSRELFAHEILGPRPTDPGPAPQWYFGHRLVLDYHVAVSAQRWAELKFFWVENLATSPASTPLSTQTRWPLSL